MAELNWFETLHYVLVIIGLPLKMWMSAKFVTPVRMEPLVSTLLVDTAAGALQITRENTAMKVR